MTVAEVKFDEAKLKEIRRLLRGVPHEMPGLISRAINKTATSARTKIARGISAEIKVVQGAVKRGLRTHKATRSRWLSTISVDEKRIQLSYFGARQIKKGVTYRIKRQGARKLIPSGFIQIVGSGHKLVMKRMGPGRYPVRYPMGPSPAAVFEGAATIAKKVISSSQQTLEKNIDSQIRYVLSKRRAG